MPSPTTRIRAVLLAALLAAACGREIDAPPFAEAPPTDEAPVIDATSALVPVEWKDAPPMIDDGALEASDDGDRWGSLRQALQIQRGWLRTRRAERTFTLGPREVKAPEMLAGVERLLAWLDEDPSPETFGAQVAHHFELYESIGDQAGDPRGDMLVTGYYVPEIAGSLRRRPGYEVPIYRPPGGFVRVDLGDWNEEWKGRRIAGLLRGSQLVPFPARQEIRTGSVPELRGKVLAWAADPVDLFFVEVQGSGILHLPDGSTRRIGYAGANGRAYRSIGKLLIDEGAVPRERMSMQAIRAWLDQNPDELHRVLDYNQSVVFFRFLEGPPVGNLGLPVTGGRSIAVDQKLLPPGGVGFLTTDRPAAGPNGETLLDGRIERFVIAQDTGGAIRGADRADYFWGFGPDAAARAGVMKQPGRLFFLAPR